MLIWHHGSPHDILEISIVVRDEIERGDAILAQRRLQFIFPLNVLEITEDAIRLVEKLLDTGAVPLNSVPDAQHIAIATVHNIEYLVSWNYKHIVNTHRRERINQVCREAGFIPTTLYTPMELMEEIQMKETPVKHTEFDPETYTDPILEECYRIKAEISAQFKTLDEFFAYLKAREEEGKRNGIKYVSYFDPSKHITPEKSEDNI